MKVLIEKAANRPAETARERIEWLVSLLGPLMDDQLEAVDYRGQLPNAVCDDVFMYRHPVRGDRPVN